MRGKGWGGIGTHLILHLEKKKKRGILDTTLNPRRGLVRLDIPNRIQGWKERKLVLFFEKKSPILMRLNNFAVNRIRKALESRSIR